MLAVIDESPSLGPGTIPDTGQEDTPPTEDVVQHSLCQDKHYRCCVHRGFLTSPFARCTYKAHVILFVPVSYRSALDANRGS